MIVSSALIVAVAAAVIVPCRDINYHPVTLDYSCTMPQYRFDDSSLLSIIIVREEYKEQRKEAKRRRKVRLMPYFSIITTAVTPLTILPVFDGITVYHAIVSSHYVIV